MSEASEIPISRLPSHIATFPQRWPFPRGDLYHWIPLLNRFDNIFDQFSQEYGLRAGVQQKPFQRILVARGVAQETKSPIVEPTSQAELDEMRIPADGDRELIDTCLSFSRELLQFCGNRSLYNSSDRINDLLNTTDLSLLSTALRLAVRLAQRYHASRTRGPTASHHLNSALLASHYNINLEKVQKLANPFVKPVSALDLGSTSSTTLTSNTKSKETARDVSTNATPLIPSSDLLSLARHEPSFANGTDSEAAEQEERNSAWQQWGNVSFKYYQPPSAPKDDQPIRPTPSRRTSAVSRPSRLSNADEPTEMSTATQATKAEEQASGGMRTIDIPASKVSSSSVTDIMKDSLHNVPGDKQYDLLTKVRVAHALSTSAESRRMVLAIRLLAITNLSYIYPDSVLQEKLLQQDSEEPRRLQLAYQLAELVHSQGIKKHLQTLALEAMEALVKHKIKAPDVCAALNINVNHGVLLSLLRNAVREMSTEDSDETGIADDNFRDALFALLDALPTAVPRAGETLLGAGLLNLLVEVIAMRTSKAERNRSKVLTFLNTIISSVRDAFQTLADNHGLDVISNLIAHDVESAIGRAENGEGIPVAFRTQAIDYQIPYFQQQSLRWVFKFVNHMMQNGSGNFDRLIRNLIDSPQLLTGLKTVFKNAPVFGSSVWSGAANIMSSFIHNEPTSYAVIAEAGLTQSFLDAINSLPSSESVVSGPLRQEVEQPSEVMGALDEEKLAVRHSPQEMKHLAYGVLPATDALVNIPHAFGAICLNHAGLDLFLKSNALDSYFQIFENPDHVKSLTSEPELSRLLGNNFDELVRHHPQLRTPVMISVFKMVASVKHLCKTQADTYGFGAKIWAQDQDGRPIDKGVLQLQGGDQDAVMGDAPASTRIADGDEQKEKVTTSTFIEAVMKFLSGFFENKNLCSSFVIDGGFDMVLDFGTLPSLPSDFSITPASQEYARIIHMMAEEKPHLVVPALISQTQAQVDRLQPLAHEHDGIAIFEDFTEMDPDMDPEVVDKPEYQQRFRTATATVKSMVSVLTLCNVLTEVFAPPIFNSRTPHTLFSQVNLSDMYIHLIRSLGRLRCICVWEEILLQKTIPEHWKEDIRTKGYGMGCEEADDVLGFFSIAGHHHTPQMVLNRIANGVDDSAQSGRPEEGAEASDAPRKRSLTDDKRTAQFRNLQTLGYLLSQIPSAITPFFQGLGKALTAKTRRLEAYSRQNAYMVAEAMAETTLQQIKFSAAEKASDSRDRYAYLIVAVSAFSTLIFDGRQRSEMGSGTG